LDIRTGPNMATQVFCALETFGAMATCVRKYVHLENLMSGMLVSWSGGDVVGVKWI
jgi:hypothetical protein